MNIELLSRKKPKTATLLNKKKHFCHMIPYPKLLNRITVLKHKAHAMVNQGVFELQAFLRYRRVPSVQAKGCPNSDIYDCQATRLDTTLDPLRGGALMPINMGGMLSTLRFKGSIDNGNQLLRAFRSDQFSVEVTREKRLFKLIPVSFLIEFSTPGKVCISSAKSNVKQQKLSQKFLSLLCNSAVAFCCIDKAIDLIRKHLFVLRLQTRCPFHYPSIIQ